MSFSHKPHLKQQNKGFKAKHSTKGALKQAAKGRLPGKSPNTSANASSAQSKIDRRNTTKQLQKSKRAALVQEARLFQGRSGVPRVVCVVELGDGTDARRCVRELADVLGEDGESLDLEGKGVVNVNASRFKTSLQFLFPPSRDIYTILDSAKAADYVVFLLSDETDVSGWGDTLLRCLQGQGIAEIVPIVQSPNPTTPPTPPPQATLKSLLSFIRYFFPSSQKVYNTSIASDASVAVRALCEGTPKDVSWREGRAWVVADSELGWVDDAEAEEGKGTLVVKGFVRGGRLSANRLVHLQNHGDFQIDKIVAAPLAPAHARPTSSAMATDPSGPEVLSARDVENADSLVALNEPDFMDNEQTWPTEEEMAGAETGSASGRADATATLSTSEKKRVPKGTSAYQAAWMVESDDDDQGSDDDDDDDDDAMEMDEGLMPADDVQGLGGLDGRDEGEEEEEEELEDIETESRVGAIDRHEDLDAEEEEEQLEEYRRSRENLDRTDLAFPDEVDTPRNIPASVRFARYRGLKSFRTSPWDPYENLPVDYARIFGFEDYEKTGKRVIREASEEGVAVGTRVEVHIKGVPRAVFDERNPALPFFVFGLFEHEHKQSVLNFVVQRNTEYDEPVKSKDPLILCVGPRRYRINPIYSQHTRGGGKGANNVHKSERFLRAGQATVATIYGPIVFGKQPCLLLRETEDPLSPILVAQGSFHNADTKRIIAKRIILTGHPFKVHKKTATIRFMFFNPEDVAYFAPVQMHTKYGRTGHITESLGTHGYYKAHFDAPINQMDTICMSLYKRAFPKWAMEFQIAQSAAIRAAADAAAGGEMDDEMEEDDA